MGPHLGSPGFRLCRRPTFVLRSYWVGSIVVAVSARRAPEPLGSGRDQEDGGLRLFFSVDVVVLDPVETGAKRGGESPLGLRAEVRVEGGSQTGVDGTSGGVSQVLRRWSVRQTKGDSVERTSTGRRTVSTPGTLDRASPHRSLRGRFPHLPKDRQDGHGPNGPSRSSAPRRGTTMPLVWGCPEGGPGYGG